MSASHNSPPDHGHTLPFSLGRREVTPAAAAALTSAGVESSALFQRHSHGDWGRVSDWKRDGNDNAVREGHCDHAIESRYLLDDGTEVLLMTAPDRSRTRLLLSSEYQDKNVTAREGYAVWASTYDTVPNPLIAIEQPLVERLLAALPPVKTAVDVGTGTGRLALLLARRGADVTGFDQSPEMLAVAERAARAAGLTDVRFVEASLDGPIPAAPDSAELVTCALVLCHVADITAAVRECARLVRPGGHLLITDFHPAAVAWGWRTAFMEPGVRYFLPTPGHSRADYLQALSAAGCAVLDIQDVAIGGEPYGDSSPEAVAARGLAPLCLTILARKGQKNSHEHAHS